MKKILMEGLLALPMVGVLSYFGQMELPVIILAMALLLDLATGLAKAWSHKALSSKTALEGALKKLAAFVAVFIGVGIDFLLPVILEYLGIDYAPRLIFGLLVVLWLCVNEFISVLENLHALGVPFPPFLKKLVEALKESVDQKALATLENNRQGDNVNE